MSDDGEVVTCHGGAQPGDNNFADVLAVDAGILEWLVRAERRRMRQRKEGACQTTEAAKAK